jgi:hypothetical protein
MQDPASIKDGSQTGGGSYQGSSEELETAAAAASEPQTGGGYQHIPSDQAQTGNNGPQTGGGSYVNGVAPPPGDANTAGAQQGSEPVTGGGYQQNPAPIQEGPQTGGGSYVSGVAPPPGDADTAGAQQSEPQTGGGAVYNPNEPIQEGPQTGGGNYWQPPDSNPPPTGGALDGDGMGAPIGNDMQDPETADPNYLQWGPDGQLVIPGAPIDPPFYFSADQGPGTGAAVDAPNVDEQNTKPAGAIGTFHDIKPEDVEALSQINLEGVGTGNQLGTNLDVTEEAVIYLPEENNQDCENNGRKMKTFVANGIFKNLRGKMQQKQCQVTAEILVNSEEHITVTAPMLQVYDNSNVLEISMNAFAGDDDCVSKCIGHKHFTMTYPDEAVTTIRNDVEKYVI